MFEDEVFVLSSPAPNSRDTFESLSKFLGVDVPIFFPSTFYSLIITLLAVLTICVNYFVSNSSSFVSSNNVGESLNFTALRHGYENNLFRLV